ncbi:hypothetical protein AcV7_002845 [Taiwanofungus camphoratus]|nr:hypothetical protein AcV7_002845 [Antrodia cinnamomea]
MTSRRRSTVHDLAALRLHPDGTRVQNSESNLRLRRAKYTARDGRGNWFARDAGGVGTVKTRRNPVRMSEGVQEAEVFDLTGADRGEGPSTPQGTRERADEEQEKEFKDGRAKKRRRFAEDLSFLESSPVPSTSAIPTATVENFLNDTPASNDTTATNLRNPSSDLLKCLHYFASTYYTAMGQLYDASREVRRAKKLKRLERLQQREENSETDILEGMRSQEAEDDEEHDSSTEEDVIRNNELEEDAVDENRDETQKRRVRRRFRRRSSINTDMYKIFDGSALVAIGMLFQEHVIQLLSTGAPEGWEAAMIAAQEAGETGDAKRRKRGNRSRKGERVARTAARSTDEDEESARETAEGEDEDEGAQHAEIKRDTRGKSVMQSQGAVMYQDDDDDDEDYIP